MSIKDRTSLLEESKPTNTDFTPELSTRRKAFEGKLVYFPKARQTNTDKVLDLVKTRAKELDVSAILVASARGDAAARAAKFLDGYKVIAVSHASGMPVGHSGTVTEINFQPFTPDNRLRVEAKGGGVLTMTRAFRGGASSALRKKFNMVWYAPMRQ